MKIYTNIACIAVSSFCLGFLARAFIDGQIVNSAGGILALLINLVAVVFNADLVKSKLEKLASGQRG